MTTIGNPIHPAGGNPTLTRKSSKPLKLVVPLIVGLRTETLKVIVKQPLNSTNTLGKYDVICKVIGGGFTGQAGAIRHGIARALNEANSEYRPTLKSAGFLTRDPRMKERKKYGLKKARKAPQFSKR